MPNPPKKQSPITVDSRSLAEVEPLCPVCGKPINAATYQSVRWPQWSIDNRLSVDFRPHELRFNR